MKNLILGLSAFMFLASAYSQSTEPRWSTAKYADNTGRVLTYKYETPAYGATITIVPNAYQTIIKPADLTGALSILLTGTDSKIGDKVTYIFRAAGSGVSKTVTMSTGITFVTSTLVVDSGQVATISFIYTGATFLETNRAKE